MASIQKMCCACSADVANQKRVKDQRGQYYCQPCYDGKVQEKLGAGVAVASSRAAVADPVDPYDFPASSEGEIGLVEEAKPAAAVHEEMFGCADCKKLVAKRQIRNDDGDFVCVPCFAKRHQQTGASARKPERKSFAEEDGGTDGELPFTYTLHGGVIISVGLIVLAWCVFLGLAMTMPAARHGFAQEGGLGFLYKATLASVETVFVLFRGMALICSMFIAARILGGCDFGYIGAAMWKALAAALFLTVINDLMERNLALMMLGFGFRGVIFALTFIILFRLDFFEAMLLSFVNFFVFWGLAIVMMVVMVKVSAMMSSRDSGVDDNEDFGPPAMVQPQQGAAPGNAAPAGAVPAGAQPAH